LCNKEKENAAMEKRSSTEARMEVSEGKATMHPDINRPVRGHYK
jgi:hypothetical protein